MAWAAERPLAEVVEQRLEGNSKGHKRAETIKRYLQAADIDPERLEVEGRGGRDVLVRRLRRRGVPVAPDGRGAAQAMAAALEDGETVLTRAAACGRGDVVDAAIALGAGRVAAAGSKKSRRLTRGAEAAAALRCARGGACAHGSSHTVRGQ